MSDLHSNCLLPGSPTLCIPLLPNCIDLSIFENCASFQLNPSAGHPPCCVFCWLYDRPNTWGGDGVVGVIGEGRGVPICTTV